MDIVGDGPELENLKTLVNSLDAPSYIQFKGAVYEGETLSKLFLGSGVYVLAGMGGLSINEAMTHSLPVICSVADGTEKHLVYEGVNGYYFTDGDANSLKGAIEKMCSSDMTAMGNASLKIIQDRINLQQVAKHFVTAFQAKK